MSLGERRARQACTLCHLFVRPDMLTRSNWREQILPRMKVRLGAAKPDYASSPEGELIRARKIYTAKPLVSPAWWPSIRLFYLSHAPEKPLPQDPRPKIEIGLKLFEAEPPRFRTPLPTATMVRILPDERRIYVGDQRTQALFVLNSLGVAEGALGIGNPPADLEKRAGRYCLTCIGSFLPTELYTAQVLTFERHEAGLTNLHPLVKDLPRATHLQFADLNEDGKEDFVLCMFGNLTGRYSWFENLGGDRWREHVLIDRTGALYSYPRDLNKDGHMDLLVLFAQELESALALLNDGKGHFTTKSLFQKPPAYGHAYFEPADFNKDGRVDLLVANGDNGEYDSPLKKCHGIRIYLNEGNLQFKEAWFFPMNGAYRAMARDFDEDGDLDIAAISYFPDYAKSPRESFVYLENEGGLKFAPYTFRECIGGRWIVMDAGDIDGDGDVDIVLGSHIMGPGGKMAPAWLRNIWERQGPSIQILRNKLRSPKPSSRAGASAEKSKPGSP